MSVIRVLRTAAATLTRTFYVDETPTDLSAPPTVTVTRLDGTAVTSGTASKPGSTTGIYTYTLPGGPTSPGSATWQLDHLDVAWAGTLAGAAVTMTDRVEVVGGFLFGIAEARASDASLANPVSYPTAQLVAKRLEVEQECERISGRAFVPRFARRKLSGNGHIEMPLPDGDVRAVRAVSVQYQPTGAMTALSNVATAVQVTPSGVMSRFDGLPWWAGFGNVIVEYEYGLDFPPEDLKEAAMYRLRSRLNLTRQGIPDRVSGYTTAEGASYRVTMPSRYSTGIPDVDAVYLGYRTTVPGFA